MVDGYAGPQRLDDRVAARDPLGLAARGPATRPGRGGLVGLGVLLVDLVVGAVLGLRRRALALEAALDAAPGAGRRLLGRLADRASARGVPWHYCFSPPVDGKVQTGPAGVSSTSIPAALIWSRIWSARAQSLAARASARWVEQALDEDVDRLGQPGVGAAGGRPPRVARVETEHVEHLHHLADRGDEGGRRAVGQQLVALADGVVEDRDRGRRPEVVVHRGDEGIGQRHLRGGAEPGRRRRPLVVADAQGGGAVEEVLDPAEAGGRLVERLEGELDVRAVVGRDDVVAQLDAAHPLEHRRDEQRVAERLAHLLAGRGDPGVVQPVRRERVPRRTRLGLLVLVVREPQVDAAAVDVEGRAEVLAGHRRALDVPARPTRAPGARPRGGLGLGVLLPALPQREVARVALAARVGVLGRLHVVEALVGQLAVRRPRPHVEVHVARAVLGRRRRGPWRPGS